MSAELSFPRHQARTQRFTLGAPRSFMVAPDGSRVLFLRAASGVDRRTELWRWDTESGQETLLVDPLTLLADNEVLSAQEQARRERARERAAGVVSYSTDSALRTAAYALSGRLFVTDVLTGKSQELATQTPVIDPRLDPGGRHIAYVANGALRVVSADGAGDRPLAEPETAEQTWGLAEFIASEEMDRFRGFWWSPEGDRLLAAHVDNSPVQRWHIADPANPDSKPTEVAYPAAGTANAIVGLAIVGLDGSRTEVSWDQEAFPYLTSVHWSAGGPPLIAVQSRDQRILRIHTVDTDTGTTVLLVEDTDEHWVDIVPGVPVWTVDGQLVRVVARAGSYRLVVGDKEFTGPDLQVRSVLATDDDGVLLRASADDPIQIHAYLADSSGVRQLTDGVGVHAVARGGDVMVVASTSLDHFGWVVRVLRNDQLIGEINSRAEQPSVVPNITLGVVGERQLRYALLLPTGYQPGSGQLPVLLSPYGGPHHQEVLAARNLYFEAQWLADQGFAVLIADGRGTPGRGPEWDREIAFDFAGVTLADQVDALHAVAAEHPELDLTKVGVRGWSYGGYLAALAVLRRPDVFHAAIAGAPVTDWRLYDTHYTERYLGHPDQHAEVYAANSLLNDAAKLEGGLMLIHGLADDNVVSAHTLRLSSALLAAGRPHTVLPLSGVTHLASQEEVAENLLLLQVDFLKKTLGMTG